MTIIGNLINVGAEQIEVVSKAVMGSQRNGGEFLFIGRGGPTPYAILIIQLIIIVAAVVVLWWIFKKQEASSKLHRGESPLDILNKRYATGGISKAQFEEIKKDIGTSVKTTEKKIKKDS